MVIHRLFEVFTVGNLGVSNLKRLKEMIGQRRFNLPDYIVILLVIATAISPSYRSLFDLFIIIIIIIIIITYVSATITSNSKRCDNWFTLSRFSFLVVVHSLCFYYICCKQNVCLAFLSSSLFV